MILKKGNTWHFGDKAHIGVDQDTGLVLHLEVTAANVHDVTGMSRLLTSEEIHVYGDSRYFGDDKREDAVTYHNKGMKICLEINRSLSQSKNNSVRSPGKNKRREQEKSSVRAKVEPVFGVVKRLLAYGTTRYKGLRKQTAKLQLLFALVNLYVADERCLAV